MSNHTQGASAPTVFPYTTTEIRVFIINDEPWFVAADVCSVLEIRNNRDALARLDEDEKGVATTDTPGGPQEMTIINESGLYSLILTSRKPEAKKFKKWVTSEVLPAIRKTGRYVHPEAARPASEAPELCNHGDMQNLSRLIYLMTHGFRHKDAFVQAEWAALRACTGVPSPQRFRVSDIPVLAAEVRRIYQMTSVLRALFAEAEKMVIGRVLRHGENVDKVLAEIDALVAQAERRDFQTANGCLDKWGEAWREQEIAAFLNRRPSQGKTALYPDCQESLPLH